IAVFGEQVVIGLFLGGTDFLGDRLIPFVAVRKDGVDVEHDAAKIEHAVAHDVAQRNARAADQGGSNGCGKFGGGPGRSEEGRVGKEWVRRFKTWGGAET